MTLTDEYVEELIVKSRHRVKAYGEVFTPRHMVDQMLDLVKHDLEEGPGFVDKTFLEPAAGDGNFLVAIAERKFAAIARTYPEEMWSRESLFALASIYGIELLEDNHQDAQAAMLAEFVRFHTARGIDCSPLTSLHRAATFVIGANVVCGNMLTGKDSRGVDVQLSWWNRIPEAEGLVQREPFTLSALTLSAIDFSVHRSYRPCRIDEVHLEVGADD